MRVRIRHQITQCFEPGTRNAAVSLKMTPRSHEGQFVQRWVLDVDCDARLHAREDAFGNLCHTFTVEGPADSVTVIAQGEVETIDTTGVVRGTVERFPVDVYLRQTDLTMPGRAVAAFADSLDLGARPDPLARLHAIMVALHETVREGDCPASGGPLAADAVLEAGAACPAGLTHLFTAIARHAGLPARHICGYFALDGVATTRHWAEGFAPEIGWIAFDSGRNLCATDNYVRGCVGLDAVSVTPLRSMGLRQEQAVSARQPPSRRRQAQSQHQN